MIPGITYDGFSADPFATLRLASFHNRNRGRQKGSTKRNSRQTRKLGSRVLVVGRFHELTLYRAAVLRHAGFAVETAQHADEALGVIRRGNFDAIVLSYTLSSEMVKDLADAAREYCPECPIVAIAERRMVDRRVAPDAIALAEEGPAALISALSQVLRSN